MQLYFIRHAQSRNNALWTATGSSEGRSMDPELTELGLRQAEYLARYMADADRKPARVPAPVDDEETTVIDPSPVLESVEAAPAPAWDPQNVSGFGITHIYSSLMIRAVQTGTILAEALGLTLHGWECIHEEGGIYLDNPKSGLPEGQAGSDRRFFLERFPAFKVPDLIGEGGWWNRPYEPPEVRPARARQFLAELLERHRNSNDRVAVISHGGFYNVFMRVVLNLPDPVESDNGVLNKVPWLLLNNTAVTRIDFNEEGVSLMYHNRASHLPPESIT